jgi:DNA-binding transcriptional MerR regulator
MVCVRIIEVPTQAAFRVSDAARYIGISPNTLRKRSDLGLIPARRDENGERIYLLRDLDAYLESLPDYRRCGTPVQVSTDWNRTRKKKESQN